MSDFDSLLSIYDSHRAYLGKKSLPPRAVDFDQFASTFFSPGPHFYYVIDSPTLTMDFVSPHVKDILGMEPEDFSFERYMQAIHPDELNYFLKCEDKVADFLTSYIAPDQVVKYKITYCLRLKTVHQGYRLFLLQTVTLQTTSEGSLLKVFGIQTDITHITPLNNYKLSFVGLQGEPSYLELDVFADDTFRRKKGAFTFTRRELEIIRLLGEGFTTSDIATRLFVSPDTVSTHRKNILLKTGFKNTTQVLVHCVRAGLI